MPPRAAKKNAASLAPKKAAEKLKQAVKAEELVTEVKTELKEEPMTTDVEETKEDVEMAVEPAVEHAKDDKEKSDCGEEGNEHEEDVKESTKEETENIDGNVDDREENRDEEEDNEDDKSQNEGDADAGEDDVAGEEDGQDGGEEDEAEEAEEEQEGEDRDWALAKILHSFGGLEEVELVSCSNIGFTVSFGSLLGLLPYRNLSFKKRPFSFEVWLQKKISDPLNFQKEISSENNSQLNNILSMWGLTFPNNEAAIKSKEKKKSALMAHESQNLLNWYNQDREKFLSSFLGQKTRAAVTLVDIKSGRLIFSKKAKINRESIEKKGRVMILV